MSYEDELELENLAISDAKSYYKKALISFCEAFLGLKKNRSSWSIVKLYYSIFYSIRADILLENYFLVRCGGFYYSTIKNGAKFNKFSSKKAKGDHQLTSYFYHKLHIERKNIDPLQDGFIDEILPYFWLMSQREKINYQLKDFSDPSIVDCLKKPATYIKNGKESYLLNMYKLADDYIYCFDHEHACLAIPFCKIQQISRKLKIKDSTIILTDNLIKHINSMECDTLLKHIDL